MLTTKELSSKLGISTTTIKRWARLGKLKNSSQNKHFKFEEDAINDFIAENSKELLAIKIKKATIEKGQKFGRLTVTCLHGTERSNKIYLCKCDCGKDKYVSASRLNRGIVTRCGADCKLDFGISIFNSIYRDYKRKGRNSKVCKFFLSKEKTFELMKGKCHYCKRPPTTTRTIKRLNGKFFTYNGIDRVDSNLPYQEDNVVSCCSVCNFMKHVLTIDQFKEHITLLYKNFVLPTK